MKMKNVFSLKNLKVLAIGFFLMTAGNACTDLKEEQYSEVDQTTADEIEKSLADPEKIVLAAYNKVSGFGGHGGIFSMQEVSSDEMLIPQRGGDWYDGGYWLRTQKHEFGSDIPGLDGTWGMLYGCISVCNRTISKAPLLLPSKATEISSELRALRALCYFYLCDMFGNVPLIKSYPGVLTEAATKPRAEIYAFVESELNAASAGLSKNPTYGRINYWAAKAILAKLYMNAQVYKGAPELDKCLAACEEIITSGKYALEADYYSNFSATNNNSKENILVVPYDEVKRQGFNLPQMTLHYASQKTFKLTDQPWNGYCSLAEFYNSYDATDKRKANLIAGPQFDADGTTRLLDDGAESNDPDGKPLNYTPEINELFPNCLRQAGARIGKYKFKTGATPNLDNDFPLFRLGDIILTKAEALWRKSPTDAVALTLVNQIRTRAGAAAFTALTADNLLAERGREVFAESWRRNDMIRFGKFFKKYDKFKTVDNEAACKGLFPIPKGQINSNSQLKQNECYN
jgi:starch-binding outer membrane protein, SusD/RagB family